MKKFLVIPLSAFLVGCSATPTQIDVPLHIVHIPPEVLFNCSRTPIEANPDTLTDHQVSDVLRVWDEDLQNCINNTKAIKKSLLKAKENLETGQ